MQQAFRAAVSAADAYSFGSQANATALPGADIDITVLGVRDMDGAAGIKRCALAPSANTNPCSSQAYAELSW